MDCVGALTACSFEESDTFLTHRFTQSYLETNNLPDLTSYLLIDTISATKKPAGLLLLLRAYITAQSKYDGICFVGVTRAGKKAGSQFWNAVSLLQRGWCLTGTLIHEDGRTLSVSSQSKASRRLPCRQSESFDRGMHS